MTTLEQKLTEKLKQALDWIENRRKGDAADALENRVSMSRNELMTLNLDALENMKGALDLMKPLTFHSSAPLNYETNSAFTARERLDSKHEDYMKKLRSRQK